MGIKNVKKNKFRKKFGINFYKKIIWEKILEKIFFGEKNVNNIFLILFFSSFCPPPRGTPIPL